VNVLRSIKVLRPVRSNHSLPHFQCMHLQREEDLQLVTMVKSYQYRMGSILSPLELSNDFLLLKCHDLSLCFDNLGNT